MHTNNNNIITSDLYSVFTIRICSYSVYSIVYLPYEYVHIVYIVYSIVYLPYEYVHIVYIVYSI